MKNAPNDRLILLVDNRTHNSRVYETILSCYGFSVLRVNSAEAALNYVEGKNGLCGAIIDYATDFLHDADADLRLAAGIRKRGYEKTIVLITDSIADTEAMAANYRLRDFHIMEKPIDVNGLLAVLGTPQSGSALPRALSA